MKRFAELNLLTALLILGQDVLGYEIDTHEVISEAAANSSVLKADSDTLRHLGLRFSIGDDRQQFPNSEGRPRNILRLVRDGSTFEDTLTLTRVRHHFFDPIRGRPLTVSGVEVGKRSPDWALEDKEEISAQEFSLKDARRYLFEALTRPTEEERSRFFGLTFQTVGHVIHHLQDMSQPQHVRNDLHLDVPNVENLPGESPSLYETYTNTSIRSEAFGRLLLQPYSRVVAFATARKYWITEEQSGPGRGTGEGIAEFTNNNFVSAGANFELQGNKIVSNPRYFLPVPETISEVAPIETLLSEAERCRTDKAGKKICLTGNLIFVRTTIHDKYLNATQLNNRASTLSIFDADLKRYNKTYSCGSDGLDTGSDPGCTVDRLFTLNRFNFDVAHQFLIPRAAAYSAGLIDYFFRGRLEAVDPEFSDSGVRLKVRNAIDVKKFPEWTSEHLYREDSQGKNSQFVLTLNYREGEMEKLLASEPVNFKTQQLVPPDVTSFETLSFDLSAPPEGATDIEYRLVFRGRLGEEDDAVAVGMVEPVSGFVVRPNYVGQNQLIVKTRGQWRVQPSTNTNAGHIDWKGWYFNGRPTKVLSWAGPVARYFPNSSFGPDPFGSSIHQNGEVFARAPCGLLGTAITKDAVGKEWLIAVCKDLGADVVYRRPNTKNGSAALFDPVFAPEGWAEIARIPPQPAALEADVPWFFNGDGTEAQTMRLSPKTMDGVFLSLWRDRYKITISNAESVVFENLGNEVGTRTDRLERVCARGIGASKETSAQRTEASTVVAVDYLDKREIVARLQHSGVGNNTWETVSGENSRLETYNIDASTEQVLKWGERELNVLQGRMLWDRKVIGFSKGAIADESRTERKFVIYFDMRSDLLVYFETVDQYSIDSGGVPDCNTAVSNCAPVPVVVATRSTLDGETYQFVSKRGPQTIYENSTETNEQVNTSVSDTGACRFTTQPENRTVTQPFGGMPMQVHSGYHPFVAERLRFSAATDSGGNHVLSMQYRDVEKVTHWFNFLTDGDLAAVIPNAPPNPTYFPVYVVK